MVILGLLLLGATGAFAGLLIADNFSNGPDYTVTILGNNIATMDGVAIFLAGIAMTLVFGLGLAIAMGGGARMRQRAYEGRHLHDEAGRAIAERDALQERVNQQPVSAPAAEQPVSAPAAEEPVARSETPGPRRPGHWYRFGH